MKKLLFTFFAIPLLATAQVPKKIIVEHFTNTKCSICASLNPGFYVNLTSQPVDVLHIAYHPSSPYVGCYFSQLNKVENDARTNYYGIYGSTPKIMVNGTLIQATNNYNDPAIFDPFENQTSPISVDLSQAQIGDSIEVRVRIKRVASGTIPALLLYGGLAEDTVNYTGSNGESQHYDVFRKATFGTTGMALSAPDVVGDSIEIVQRVVALGIWNVNRMYAYAIVQEVGNRKTVQSSSLPVGIQSITANESSTVPNFEIYPNPVDGFFTVQTDKKSRIEVKIVDMHGRVLQHIQTTGGSQISTSLLQPGLYSVLVTINGKTTVRKIVK